MFFHLGQVDIVIEGMIDGISARYLLTNLLSFQKQGVFNKYNVYELETDWQIQQRLYCDLIPFPVSNVLI